jgi:N-acyl-D-aspartate/D-glutamate deacylase
MYDLVIRNGLVVDGTGAPGRVCDVAVEGDRIAAVGDLGDVTDQLADAQVIDGRGMIVTPGFVDIHTHYDGQVLWDPALSPSSWHGVTTLVMGNCGVGFAPAAPERRDWVVGLMEGVEEIPRAAIDDGLPWRWETFAEYLDALDRAPKAVDVGAQVPHGTVRAHVMGERGIRNEPATDDDIARMSGVVADALAAGALGVTTSRTVLHRSIDGEPVPGTFASEDELFGIGRALASAGRGVFELAPAGIQGEDTDAPARELDWMCRLASEIGRPVTYGLVQHDIAPDDWRRLLDLAADAAAQGVPLRPQVAGRPVGLLLGLQTRHPLFRRPTFTGIARLSLDEQVARLRDPETRARILAEAPTMEQPAYYAMGLDRIFVLGDPPDYEPTPEQSIAGLAAAAGVDPVACLYDQMLQDDGHALLSRPLLGYSHFNLDALHDMIVHPATVLGLGDGGAHVRVICDASSPTFMITHWVRDRERGPRLPLEAVVHKMTANNAALYGLDDRGTIAVGMKADLNVIDLDHLRLLPPEYARDLPGGAGRVVQRAEGYEATIVAGRVTRRKDADTGVRPGRLVRS